MLNTMNFDGMDSMHFLVGLLNDFVNRLQTKGDSFFKEISWKQCFLLICIKLFDKPPAISELSGAIGTSHQNVKQMLLKLEKGGYIKLFHDSEDRRKQRVMISEKGIAFDQKYAEPSREFMEQLFSGIDSEELKVTVKTMMKLDSNLKEMRE